MKGLIVCEESQEVTKAFREAGHEFYSNDIQDCSGGHGETKATCLWLVNLPKLLPTDIVEGREQKMWKLPPSEDRAKLRSKTYSGIAKAMATQWTQQQLRIAA